MIVSFLIMEQVLYINGRPFVLREVERPFSNLEYTVRHGYNWFFILTYWIFYFIKFSCWFCGIRILHTSQEFFFWSSKSVFILIHDQTGCIQWIYQKVKNLQNMIFYKLHLIICATRSFLLKPKENKGVDWRNSTLLLQRCSYFSLHTDINASGTTFQVLHFLILTLFQLNNKSFIVLDIALGVQSKSTWTYPTIISW